MPYWPLESRGRVSLLLENERTLVICIYCRRRCIAVSSITSCLFLSTSLLLGLCSLGWVIMEPTVGEPHVWENLAVAIVGFVILSPPSALECTRMHMSMYAQVLCLVKIAALAVANRFIFSIFLLGSFHFLYLFRPLV